MTENNNRVCCLYRVSTDKQVDFTSNHEADLPMQRKACHKFAESKGLSLPQIMPDENRRNYVNGNVNGNVKNGFPRNRKNYRKKREG